MQQWYLEPGKSRDTKSHNKSHPKAAMLCEAWGEKWGKRQSRLTEGKPKGWNQNTRKCSINSLTQATLWILPKVANEKFFIKNNKLMNNTKEALPPSQIKLHKTTYRTKPEGISRLATSYIGSQLLLWADLGTESCPWFPFCYFGMVTSIWEVSHVSIASSFVIPLGTTPAPKACLDLHPLVTQIIILDNDVQVPYGYVPGQR